MEGAYSIKTGIQSVSFSNQQGIDCAREYGNYGCAGGKPDRAFDYYKDHWINTEHDYPYSGYYGYLKGVCGYDETRGLTKVIDYVNIPTESPEAIKEYLKLGPVAAALSSAQTPFKFYESGVITSHECALKLDHAILIVGHGIENGHEYFLVKNSWGADWGLDGYVKVGISSGPGYCGLNIDPSQPYV